jgi:hypothetical protein
MPGCICHRLLAFSEKNSLEIGKRIRSPGLAANPLPVIRVLSPRDVLAGFAYPVPGRLLLTRAVTDANRKLRSFSGYFSNSSRHFDG